MSRLIERAELRRLLESSGVPFAAEFAAAVDPRTVELVAVHPVDQASMLSTYEVRLARSSAGEGPRTLGLDRFVEALGGGRVAEVFSVRTNDRMWRGLLDSAGRVVAVTGVERDQELEKLRDREWTER